MRWALLLGVSLGATACASGGDLPDDESGGGYPDARPGTTAYDAAEYQEPLYPDAGPPGDAPQPDSMPCTGGDVSMTDPATGHCYLLFLLNYSWADASSHCGARLAHLVTITDAAENTFVDGLVGDRTVWIGATDGNAEGAWSWVTTETFAFSHWASGQPDNGSGSEDCVELKGENGGRWNDDQCGNDKRFVCER